MMGNVGAAKRLRFSQTTAEREEILTQPNNIDPSALTPTLSPTGRGRRALEPMSNPEHISLFVFRWLKPLQLHELGELPLPAGERVGVRGLGR
jgi:hypothetical protein